MRREGRQSIRLTQGVALEPQLHWQMVQVIIYEFISQHLYDPLELGRLQKGEGPAKT